tara:strand:+ start:132 stop:257 length:126 start_codon:yes stop_codon:yes gene_type:complete
MMGGGMMYGSTPSKKRKDMGDGGNARMTYTDGGLVDFKNPN